MDIYGFAQTKKKMNRQSHRYNFLYFTYISLLMNSLSCLSSRRSSLGQLYTAKSVSLRFRKVKSLEKRQCWNRCTVLVIWAGGVAVHWLYIARQPENIQKTTESDPKSWPKLPCHFYDETCSTFFTFFLLTLFFKKKKPYRNLLSAVRQHPLV